MIDSIKLVNFESHPNSELVFTNGVNVIGGSSDNGKSSIIRALLWVLNNPQGDAMVSNFIKKRGKQVGVTSVTIDKGGHTIVREKSRVKDGKNYNEFNGYKTDWGEYTATRGNVPEEITKVFNINDCNISTQFEPHFLLSNTPGEVSKYINSIVNLDVQDVVLAELDRRHRACNRDIAQLESRISDNKNKLKDLNWVDIAKEEMNKVDTISSNINDITNKINIIVGLVNEYHQKKCGDDNKLLAIKNLCSNITDSDIDELQKRIDGILDLIDSYPVDIVLPDINPYMDTAQNAQKRLQLNDSRLGGIVTHIKEYNASEAVYEERNAKLERLRDKLSVLIKESKNICPYSNQYCKHWRG